MVSKVEVIIEAIRLAFANTPRGVISMHEAEAIDSYASDEEQNDARKLDKAETWDQIDDHDIEKCSAALSHLDPEGWRFYIPAYMIWSLKYFAVTDSIIPDFTIYTFDLPGTDANSYKRRLYRFQLLNAAQSHAVCLFLRYMAATSDQVDDMIAKEALNKYWDKFCEKASFV